MSRLTDFISFYIQGQEQMAVEQLSQMVLQSAARPKDVLESIKPFFKHGTPIEQTKSIQLLDNLVDKLGMHVVPVLATEVWIERITKTCKASASNEFKILLQRTVAKWAATFGFRPFVAAAEKMKKYLPPGTSTSLPLGAPQGGVDQSQRAGNQQPSQLETFLITLHEDVASFEMAIQRPERMTKELAAQMRAHQDQLTSVLVRSQGISEHTRFTLINEQRTLEELLGLYDAIFGPEGGAAYTSPRNAQQPPVAVGARNGGGSRHADPQELPSSVPTAAPPTDTPIPPQAHQNNSNLPLPAHVTALQEAIRHLKAQISSEKNENKNALQRMGELEEQIRTVDEAAAAATQASVVVVRGGPPKGFVLNRARNLLEAVRSTRSEWKMMRGRFLEMFQAQSALFSKVGEALESVPATAEQERKRDGKAAKRLQELYQNEMKLRKQYYNTIQELKGNMRVFCRVRPPPEATNTLCVSFPKTTDEIVVMPPTGAAKKFEFDAVFGPEDDQDDVFQDSKQVIDSVLDGYNVCIAAYGEKGSGRTHTLLGTPSDVGMLSRVLHRLFEEMEGRPDESTTINVGCITISADDRIQDMLSNASNLDFRVDGELGIVVSGAETMPVESSSVESVVASIRQRVGPNSAQRSHTLYLVQACIANTQTGLRTIGKLCLLDFCGMDAPSAAPSLSNFHDIINGLGSGSSQLPFRASKLGTVLQEYMTGQAKMVIYLCVHPTSQHASDTLATLQFGTRARGVPLGKTKDSSKSKK